MQFLNAVFGGAGNSVLTGVLALGIVLVLIVLGVWLLKVGFKASTNLGRGRNRRLSVVDTLMIDPRRQLIIVRRDNVEHLLLTGGPHDVVIETGIPAETTALRRGVAQRSGLTGDGPSSPGPVPASPNEPHMGQGAATGVRHPVDLRKAKSLRHTGLMRPVAHTDPAFIPMSREVWVENSDRGATDSVKTGPVLETGQAKFAGGKPRLFRGSFKADRT